MNKYEALKAYLGMNPKIKWFKKHVIGEVCDAIWAWKNDLFAPTATEIMSVTDEEFVTYYETTVKDTVQHELSEAIEHIDNFAAAHGLSIFDYYEILKKYRKLKNPEPKRIVIIKK